MKYLDEFREPQLVASLAERIRSRITRPWTIMEVCGGQTHTLVKSGLDQLLPPGLELVHGPGCPVCVTPIELLDRAMAIAARPGVIFTSFGDMLRVPGSQTDLLSVRAAGGDVRAVYSPLDALQLASRHPERDVVFFAVGFETTAPVTALAIRQAARLGLTNFSALVAHVRVVPAMEAILAAPGNTVQGFLAAGHVCAVTGFAEYPRLAERYRVPIVVTGFEPVDLLEGIARLVDQLETGRAEVENQYERAVTREGNLAAQAIVAEVYEVCERSWRGLGELPASGLRLRPEYAAFDAERRFSLPELPQVDDNECQAGLVLQGRLRPDQCPAYGSRCTPAQPLGAPMVSSEGACAAYFHAGRPAQVAEGVPA